jgi:chemotaxis protein methyltransferase CheR
MFDQTYSMSDTTYRSMRELIYNFCGLTFDDNSKYFFEKRLSNRVHLHQLRDFQEYYYYLMYDKNRSEELSTIVDILTINETYFFREEQQLKAFAEEILPELKEKKEKEGQRSLRIWSAGCSTGEEPYTLAMLILQSGLCTGWDVEIFASDISHRVLQSARKGEYTKSSFRVTKEDYIRKYFTEEGGKHRLNDPVRRLVNFGYLNLFDSSKIFLLGKMDVIFCRNVIIYFDKAAKKKVIDHFERQLNEEGYLLLGHSESLINLSTAFRLKHLKNDMVYQRA